MVGKQRGVTAGVAVRLDHLKEEVEKRGVLIWVGGNKVNSGKVFET